MDGCVDPEHGVQNSVIVERKTWEGVPATGRTHQCNVDAQSRSRNAVQRSRTILKIHAGIESSRSWLDGVASCLVPCQDCVRLFFLSGQ
jgi:hypothetical protein